MSHIFIDESGDLGMSEKGSRYFILAGVRIDDDQTRKAYSRIPKDVRQRTLSKKTKKMCELKFANSSPLIRERFIGRAAKLNLGIYALIIEKRYVSQKLKDDLPILYNYLSKVLLEGVLRTMPRNEKIHICMDRCMSRSQRENFEAYIKTEFLHLFGDLPEMEIKHESSHDHAELLVTDFICGAFGYKYNTASLGKESAQYTSLIHDKIKLERTDFFKEK